MYVLAIGGDDGWEYFGPFDSFVGAVDYLQRLAEKRGIKDTDSIVWDVASLSSPEEIRT